MKPFRIVIVLLVIAAAFLGGYGYARRQSAEGVAAAAKGEEKPTLYRCPMHPTFTDDRPSDCPICGMKLVPVVEGPAVPAVERQILHYRDPEHPEYTSENPGFNPETGNELEPVYADDPSAMPPGTVQITPEKQQLIGVRYGEVEYAVGAQTVRAVGRVAMDETRVHHIHSRTEGWIEQVHVGFTGDLVRKGQPLLSIYSPELLASQREYLLALKARDILKGSTVRGVSGDNDALVAAARRRLQLWDLSEAQIAQIEKTGEPVTSITLYSNVGGYVLTRNAFHNQKVTLETELYTIADLSRIWVLANVFEFEAPLVQLGQSARIILPYNGNRAHQAKVTYIQPQVDAATRTLQVRLELDNPGLALKPEMFVDVELSIAQPKRLAVPVEAVLDTGLRQTVFVDRGNGWFEPRQVQTGQPMGDRIEILSGLKAGERIVTSGTFLIDSESQLQSAASGMGVPAGVHDHGSPPAAPAAPAAPVKPDPHAGHGAH